MQHCLLLNVALFCHVLLGTHSMPHQVGLSIAFVLAMALFVYSNKFLFYHRFGFFYHSLKSFEEHYFLMLFSAYFYSFTVFLKWCITKVMSLHSFSNSSRLNSQITRSFNHLKSVCEPLQSRHFSLICFSDQILKTLVTDCVCFYRAVWN